MKTIKNAGIALLALLATACAKDDPQAVTDPVAVKFSTNINLTRAVDTSWEDNDRIGIYMFRAGSAEAVAESANKKYRPAPADNTLSPDGVESTLYFPQDGSAVDFLAYCPYRELAEPVCPINVADQSRQNAIDFLYAVRVSNRTPDDPNVAFVFQHRLSKLILDVTTSTGADLSSLTARINGMNTVAAFDLSAGTLGEGSAPEQIAMYRNGDRFEAILLPAALTDACSVEFVLDGETFTWKIAETIPTLVGSHKYLYRVTLTPETPILTPVGVTGTITDWIPEDSGDVTLQPEVTLRYRVGDYYPDPAVDTTDPESTAGVEGIVFEVTDDGKHGKMLSLTESSGLQWSTTGAKDDTLDENDGMVNFNIIRDKDADFTAYPAFAWCASLGEGWYIPAVNELLAVRTAWGLTNADKEAFNDRIAAVNGEPLKASVFVESRGSNQSAYYYTSTEKADAANKALSVSFNSTSGASDGLKKSSNTAENLLFRAIKTF